VRYDVSNAARLQPWRNEGKDGKPVKIKKKTGVFGRLAARLDDDGGQGPRRRGGGGGQSAVNGSRNKFAADLFTSGGAADHGLNAAGEDREAGGDDTGWADAMHPETGLDINIMDRDDDEADEEKHDLGGLQFYDDDDEGPDIRDDDDEQERASKKKKAEEEKKPEAAEPAAKRAWEANPKAWREADHLEAKAKKRRVERDAPWNPSVPAAAAAPLSTVNAGLLTEAEVRGVLVAGGASGGGKMPLKAFLKALKPRLKDQNNKSALKQIMGMMTKISEEADARYVSLKEED